MEKRRRQRRKEGKEGWEGRRERGGREKGRKTSCSQGMYDRRESEDYNSIFPK